MADVIASLTAQIGADVSGFQSGLGKVKSGIGDMANTIKNVGIGAVLGLTTALVGIGIAAVKSASDSQTEIAQLRAVLKSTGGVAGVTEQAALDLASSLQRVTRFSDEQITSAESMLLTFKGIGKTTFPLATQSALDMATALDMDTDSAAKMLGKLLESKDGLDAATRQGVRFTEQQKQQIKYYFDTNQAAKAQAIILKELQAEFGGSAEAAGSTFAGSLDKLKNALDDILETVGNLFLPALTSLATGFADMARSAGEGIQNFINIIKAGLAGGNLGDIFKNIVASINPGQIVASILQALGMDANGAAQIGIRINDFFMLVGKSIGNAINDLFAHPLEGLANPTKLGHMAGLEGASETAAPFIERLKKALGDLAPIIQPAVDALKGVAETAERLVKIGEITVFKTLSDAYDTLQKIGQLARIVILDQLSQINPLQFGMLGAGIATIAGALAIFLGLQAVSGIISGIAGAMALLTAPAWLAMVPIVALVAALTWAAITNFGGFQGRLAELRQTFTTGWASPLNVFDMLNKAAKAAQDLIDLFGILNDKLTLKFDSPFLSALYNALGPIWRLVDNIVKDIETIQSYLNSQAAGTAGSGGGGAGFGGGEGSTATPTGGATGMYMPAGTLGLVGERGPELFRPSVDGRIIPNSALSGGGTNVNLYGNIYLNTDNENAILDAVLRAAKNRGANWSPS